MGLVHRLRIKDVHLSRTISLVSISHLDFMSIQSCPIRVSSCCRQRSLSAVAVENKLP